MAVVAASLTAPIAPTAPASAAECGSELSFDNYDLVAPGCAASADDPSDAEALVESCEPAEAVWVGQAYQMQLSAQEVNAIHIAKPRPVVEECLAREGAEVDPSLGDYELLDFAVDYMVEHDAADCTLEAEIYGC